MPAKLMKVEYFTYRARQWELTWWWDGRRWSCIVSSVQYNVQVVWNAHLVPSPRRLLDHLDEWLADPEKRAFMYSDDAA